MPLQIFTPEMRQAEPRGARIVIAGPFGVGKTSLARTLDPERTLIVDIENGTLPINDFPFPHVRPETWPEVQDAIVRVAGANRSFGPNEAFSQAHLDRVGGLWPGVETIDTVFFDTLAAASQLCLRWATQQPENFSDRTGKLDLRNAYGQLSREFQLALRHLQSARGKNISLISPLESVTDEYGHTALKIQTEGRSISSQLPGIVDLLITMNWLTFDDAKPIRALVCTSPNPWNFPAKDRSGRLDMVEPPDLARLIAKVLPPRANHSASPGRQDSPQQTPLSA